MSALIFVFTDFFLFFGREALIPCLRGCRMLWFPESQRPVADVCSTSLGIARSLHTLGRVSFFLGGGGRGLSENCENCTVSGIWPAIHRIDPPPPPLPFTKTNPTTSNTPTFRYLPFPAHTFPLPSQLLSWKLKSAVVRNYSSPLS